MAKRKDEYVNISRDRLQHAQPVDKKDKSLVDKVISYITEQTDGDKMVEIINNIHEWIKVIKTYDHRLELYFYNINLGCLRCKKNYIFTERHKLTVDVPGVPQKVQTSFQDILLYGLPDEARKTSLQKILIEYKL